MKRRETMKRLLFALVLGCFVLSACAPRNEIYYLNEKNQYVKCKKTLKNQQKGGKNGN